MIILASSSPRRKILLRELINSFEVINPEIDETSITAQTSALPQEISKIKAYAVFQHFPEATVLACDTIVYFRGQQLGKPRDAANARRMLSLLSGQTHKVISGYTLINQHIEINRTVVTRVTFHDLPTTLIEAYVASGLPLDKAGAYGIQDTDYPLVKSIVGSYSNVMGLPLENLAQALKRLPGGL